MAYFRAKILCGYVMALLTIVVLCLLRHGARGAPGRSEWVTVIGLLLVGLIPFAILGILLGHLVKTDSIAPAIGGITTLFALLGGVYGFQLAHSGPLFDVIRALPSYWLVQAGKTALGGGVWHAEGWIVVGIWTAVLTPLAVWVYRRDTGRA